MTPRLIVDILPWVTPPVIGAVIGWVTNDIAIRMLFRPLKEIRILGIRMPFTPGIFPKERRTLARSIGKMVSRELITEEALRKQVHAEKTMVQLAQSVSDVSAQVLSTPLAAFSQAGSALVSSSLRDILHDLLRGFFSSRALIYAVRDILTRGIASISSRKVKELLGRFDLKAFVTERLLPLLAERRNRESLAKSVASAIGDRAGSILTDEVLESFSSLIAPAMPMLADRLVEWLKSGETRELLRVRGRQLLSSILEKLNVIQRFILSAGQFDRRLDQKMPEIVEDVIRSLEELARDPAEQERVLKALGKAARDWRDGVLEGKGSSRQAAAAGIERAMNGLLARLEDPGARRDVYEFVESRFIGSGDQSLGSFLRNALGIQDTEIVEYLANQVLSFLSRDETAQTFSRELLELARRFMEDNAQSPIGELLRIDPDRKKKLDAFLLAKLIDLVDTRLPEILRGVDVEELVVQKIDGLEVRDVERLLLGVIATHLKWINVFGAILGFLIGLFQILLRLLRLA